MKTTQRNPIYKFLYITTYIAKNQNPNVEEAERETKLGFWLASARRKLEGDVGARVLKNVITTQRLLGQNLELKNADLPLLLSLIAGMPSGY